VTALVFGTLSGFRHAFEPDHLAAVSTLVTERPGPLRAARLGAWWGLGHTLALAGVGALLAVVDATLSPRVEEIFELGVAIMLLVLGVRAVGLAIRSSEHRAPLGHRHWFSLHRHAGLRAHVHVGQRTLALRPLTIGVIHGLAGSGALTALVMSSLPTTPLRLAYTVLFGLASTAGMALVSGLAGLSLARFTQSDRALSLMSLVTGTLSVTVAALWGYPILHGWIVP
jgi:hypothetical protein